MQSYTSGRNLYGSLTNNSGSTNLSLGDTIINSKTSEILGKKPWPFLERTANRTSWTGGDYVVLPHPVKKLKQVTATVSGSKYPVRILNSRAEYDALTASTATASYPTYCYPNQNQLLVHPYFSDGSATITAVYTMKWRGLSVADYTTGTITTATQNGTAIVGGSTGWTSQMAGRYIKIAESNAANVGDGEWYEIDSVSSGTALAITRPYAGASIAAGTATYTIGQISPLPDGYHEGPIYHAVATYYKKNGDSDRATLFEGMAEDNYKALSIEYSNPTDDLIVSEGNETEPWNANWSPNLQ